MTEAEERAAVVAEAKTWLGTPYHPCSGVKGAGVDCGWFLYYSFVNPGIVPPFTIEKYSPQWHLHRGAERYLAYITNLARERTEENYQPQPGDIIMFKFGRTFSHAAIVVDHPIIIHAVAQDRCVVLDDIQANKYLTVIGERGLHMGEQRPIKIYSLNHWS